jgi:hypothetical protein
MKNRELERTHHNTRERDRDKERERERARAREETTTKEEEEPLERDLPFVCPAVRPLVQFSGGSLLIIHRSSTRRSFLR